MPLEVPLNLPSHCFRHPYVHLFHFPIFMWAVCLSRVWCFGTVQIDVIMVRQFYRIGPSRWQICYQLGLWSSQNSQLTQMYSLYTHIKKSDNPSATYSEYTHCIIRIATGWLNVFKSKIRGWPLGEKGRVSSDGSAMVQICRLAVDSYKCAVCKHRYVESYRLAATLNANLGQTIWSQHFRGKGREWETEMMLFDVIR